MCFKMVSGNSKIVFNRLRFTLFPVTPSLKSDWNCLPHEGHFINIPPMSSGNRNCWPHSGHFLSLYSVMVGLDLFNIVRGVFLSASRLPPRVAFIQVSRTGRRPMVGQPACVGNGMRPSLLLKKHSIGSPIIFQLFWLWRRYMVCPDSWSTVGQSPPRSWKPIPDIVLKRDGSLQKKADAEAIRNSFRKVGIPECPTE